MVDLSGIATPSHATITGSGYTVSFSTAANQEVVQNAAFALRAIPVAGVSGSTPEYLTGNYGSALTANAAASGNYLSTGTGSITFTFSTPQTSLAVLWGSIDPGNSLTFNDAGSYKVTGTAVQAAAAGFAGNGFQGPGGSAYVVVDTSTPFTTVTAASSIVSFEFAGLAADTASFTATPEPSSFLLFGLGLAMTGLSVFKRYQGAHRKS